MPPEQAQSESTLIPRNIEYAWATVSAPAKVINTYQPAGKIEDFFHALGKFKDLPTREQAIEKSYTAQQIDGLKRVFEAGSLNIPQVSFAAPADSGENALTSKEDGLLATVLFRRVFISYSDRFVVFEPW